MANDGICPIWGTPALIRRTSRDGLFVNSSRASGEYFISGTAVVNLKNEDDSIKAKLTTWLIDQRLQGANTPEITSATITQVQQQRPLPVLDRADRLLKYLEQKNSPAIGKPVESNIGGQTDQTLMEMLAWSESPSVGEVLFLADYLVHCGWINKSRNTMGKFMPIIMVEGYARLAELKKPVDSSQGFVAMWFDGSMAEAYEKGIKPGIEDAGYKPIRIDQKEHLNKIDDEIIAEIMRSGFVVADFTQKDNEARGGVYYEAGFAHGLKKPVIFTCRKDALDKLHFDTRQFPHIVWETHEDLRKQLAARISAVIGDGPLKSTKAE